MRRGALGQAWELYDEPNTYPVFTCYKYCANPVYFTDTNYDDWIVEIEKSFQAIPTNKPIIPCRRIGEGCARLKEFGPRLLEYIQQRIKQLQYPNLIIDWNSMVNEY